MGIPGSGKSTYAKKHLPNVISSDELRKELLGDEEDQDNNDLIFTTLYSRVEKGLKEGLDMTIDATNISAKGRKALIERFRKFASRFVAYYFATDYRISRKRNWLRDRTVPKSAMRRMRLNLQVPTYSEGWDEIVVIGGNSNDMDLSFNELNSWINSDMSYEEMYGQSPFDCTLDIYEMPHDSTYHSFSVGRHNYYVWKDIYDNYHEEDRSTMLWAAFFHDVGKYEAKNFKRFEDGSISRYANYIGHENVSAQLVVQCLIETHDIEDVLEIAELVQYHMRLHSVDIGSKGYKRLEKQLGEKRMTQLIRFHEADNKGK